ncbi:MAG: M1 family metallopeptidase [bacterium]|nr:M1 family metallopeptidase [bacterium]
MKSALLITVLFILLIGFHCFVWGTSPNPVLQSGVVFFSPQTPVYSHYTIDYHLDEKGNVNASLSIRVRNRGRVALPGLAFSRPAGKGFQFTVSLNGKPLSPMPGVPKESRRPRVFPLPRPLAPGQEIILKVEVRGHLDLPRFLEQDHSYASTGWVPLLWWEYDVHSDYDVKLDLPANLPVITSGRFNPASGRWLGKNIRSFAVVMGRKDLKILEASAGDVLVRVLVLNDDNARKCANLVLDTAVDVVNFYRQRFGFYPGSTISLVPGGPGAWGGYPMATNVVVIHGMQVFPQKKERHWKWITAHELGHQFFIEHVLEKESHRWLVIGLGIYADREWSAARNPGDFAHKNFMDRFIAGVNKRNDTTAVLHRDALELLDFDFNNVVVHGKGYCIIAALELLMGKEPFYRVYIRLLKEFQGRPLSTGDFQRVCEEVCGQNLDWFFSQWVYSSRFISYSIISQSCDNVPDKPGSYVSTVSVKNAGDMEMPIPVRAYFNDGSSQLLLTNRLLKEESLIFKSNAPLKEVKIDPDGILPNVVPVPEMSVTDLHRVVSKLKYSGQHQLALELFPEAVNLKYAKARGWLKLSFNLYDGKHYKEALIAFRNLEKFLSNPKGSWKMSALAWQGIIHDLTGNRPDALKCYKNALNYAKDKSMKHSQFNMTINAKWLTERLKSPFKR